MEPEIGKEYRRRDLHTQYGGQQQSGISTPSKYPFIFLFSGEKGERYGYTDEWREDGYYYYTGEGTNGDMQFHKGNRAIRDHSLNNKRIFLFIETKPNSPIKILSHELFCVDYEYIQCEDETGTNRRGIRFILEDITKRNDNVAHIEQEPTKPSPTYYKEPNNTERKGLVTTRVGQGQYRQKLLNKFGNKCAVTGCDIPEILIASHIVPWRSSNSEERLDENNGILLSPSYDALFDRNLISFTEEGEMVVSLQIKEKLDVLGIDPTKTINVSEGMKPYLRKHLSKLRK